MPYVANALWSVWDEEYNRFVAFTGTFEEGKIYEMFLSVRPKEGFRFDEETTLFYVDGKEIEPDSISSRHMDFFYSYPSETEQVIKNVEVTIEKPVSGNHSSVRPVIVLPDGANYMAGDNGDWMVKIGDQSVVFMDYFVDGADYGVHFNLTAKKGYVFADDLKIKVNGTTLPDKYMNPGMKTVSGNYFFSMVPDPTINPIKTVSLSATKYMYNGKVKTPSVTVKDTSGKKLTLNKDYAVTYAQGKTYYYKVRSYKTVNGKKVFGPWSNVKKFKRK